MSRRSGNKEREEVLGIWTERDLVAAAAAGEVAPAFEVDDVVQQVADVLASGRQPLLVGPGGVGKTAIVGELVRQVVAGNGPASLRGKRILEISFRHRASTLKKPDDMRPEMQRLVEVLLEEAEEVVPFFRDAHLAYWYDLEPQLQALGFRFRGAILGEGELNDTRAMFENSPELDKYFVLLEVEEPGLQRTARLLTAWSAEQTRHGRRFTDDAVDEALHLTHRFLARSRMPRKAVDLLGQTASVKPRGATVTRADVIDRFSRDHRVPRPLVDPSIRLDLRDLEEQFSTRVLGQAEAIRSMVQMIGLIKAGLSDPRRPFGVFLFVGPTGVGKTHVAQLLAEHLFGSRDRVLRFNMADFQGEMSAETLFGNPEDGRPAHRRGMITQRVAGHSFAVLLLDEFEKAHARVHDRFLQLVDEGSFINGASELISCRSMIIIATSNAGAEVYRTQGLGFGSSLANVDELTRELNRRLAQSFRFEFLNRFDRVVHFRPLTREHIRTIAARELEALKERSGLKRRNVTLEVDEVVLDWLAAHGYDPYYGARFLRRTIERHVTTALAEVMVRVGPDEGARVELTVRQDRVVARLAPGRTGAPREAVLVPVGHAEQSRTLDRRALLGEVDALLATAAPRLATLAAQREESSALLARMSEPGFWEDQARSREVLERFRTLDVALQVAGRLATPLERLAAQREAAAKGGAALEDFARGFEAAARALREWDDRLAEDGAGAVWLVLSNVDPLHPAADFIADLVKMEVAWCGKLGLGAAVAAYEPQEAGVERVALEVEGPGAAAYLAMEEGLHRLARRAGPDLRVAAEVVPQSGSDDAVRPRVASARRRKGAFDLQVSCAGRVDFPERGQVIDLVAQSPETLGRLLADLGRHWRQAPAETPEVARLYGHEGSGGRDPRTGVVVPRLRDVLKGELDRFLEGWRRQARAGE